MNRRLIAALSLASALAPLSVRADDWLAVLPACSIEGASRPELTLLYPAPGLPALVHAGEALIARVRVPAALTPPPGVQQERVLARYTAELTASPQRLGVAGNERHRHALPVTSVRPDAASTLVYRLRIDIPAYVAEGTYSIAVRTPFGSRHALHALRVLAPGARPRVQRLPEELVLPPSTAATRPVDVWLSNQSSAGAPDAADQTFAPVLLATGGSIALRWADQLWVRAGCTDRRAFERELTGLLREERRRRVELPAAPVPPPPLAAELERAPSLSIERDAAVLDNAGLTEVAELSLLVPFAASVRTDAGRVSFHPAREPAARSPGAKLVRWHVPAGVRARLQLGAPRRGQPELQLLPRRAHSGQPAHLRVLGAEAGARVAFALGFARSAYAPPALTTSFAGPLAYPVRAQVFATDGSARAVEGHVWVEPHRPPNCAIRGKSVDPSPARLAFSVAFGWALARFVRRRRAKNARGRARPE